jgi:cell division septum initiation protein DivIVA
MYNSSEPSQQSPVAAPPPGHPNQALHVLTMAQRTAEEHIARARHQADKIHSDAAASAEQMGREAMQHAHGVRREADKVLADAREAAEQGAADAEARTDEARRDAEKIVADARAAAAKIAAEAAAGAEQLGAQAKQRYDDVVGSLVVKREALQEQVEALERFDREYRARLTSFMQGQMRALWADRPEVTGDPEPPAEEAAGDRAGQVDRADQIGQIERAGEAAGQPKPAVPAQRDGRTAEYEMAGAHAGDD